LGKYGKFDMVMPSIRESSVRDLPRVPFWYLEFLGRSYILENSYSPVVHNNKKIHTENHKISWPF